MLKQKLRIISNKIQTKFIVLFATVGICVVASVLSINKNVDADVMKPNTKDKIYLCSKVPKQKSVKKVILKSKRQTRTQRKQKSSRGCNNPYLGRTFNITASHYSGREEENGKGRAYKNALGKPLTYRTIAVPRNIPLGSIIKLTDNEGNSYIKIALDYGSRKHIRWINNKTMKIDVCKPYASKQKISKLGIKHYKGQIIRWGF